VKTLLLGHVLVTWFLVGLIWTIQVVHYPSFALVGRDEFGGFHAAHLPRITSLVMLPMVLELLSAGALVFVATELAPRWSLWLGLALVVLIWASTALVQVPLHESLGRQFSSEVASQLVFTNWLRTAAWTARGVLGAWWVWRLIR